MVSCDFSFSPKFPLFFGLTWGRLENRLEVLAYDVSMLLAFLQPPFGLWPMVLAWGCCLTEAPVTIAERHRKQKNSCLCVFELRNSSAGLQYTCAHILVLQMQQPELDNLHISVHLGSLKGYHACSDLQSVCDLQHDAAWNNVGWSLKRLASTAQQSNLLIYHLFSQPY